MAGGIEVAIITSLPMIDVHIGDQSRGPVAQKSFTVAELLQIPDWLREKADKFYPGKAKWVL